ncbi:MAG TPA: galactokinase [Gemmatimonadales bacterium]|nr:galactokinase [Gemmatimonadales bacterium]
MTASPVERAVVLFRTTYRVDPCAVASAPGRVNLIGEHVDYHGGHVLPMATAERTAVAVGPMSGTFRGVSEEAPAVELAWPVERSGSWADYVAGVARLLAPRAASRADGLAVAVASDVPLGSGLSSSAAIEVAAAAALSSWWQLPLEPRGLAAVAHTTETDYVGVPCGVMDQMASALSPEGAALLLNCATLETRAVPARLDIVLVDSGEAHSLRKGAYAERRREGDAAMAALRAAIPGLQYLVDVPAARMDEVAKLPPPLDRRARHVIEENQRTLAAARALETGDLAAFGRLVYASHESLRDLYECSTPRLDAIVAAARKVPGALGARLVGAGWGGWALVAAESGRGPDVAAALRRDLTLPATAVREERPGHGVTVGR